MIAFAAEAATITVNTTSDEFDSFFEGTSDCSLREAIQSANNDGDFGGCVGSGAYGDDTITVPAGTYLIGSFGGCEGGFDNSQGDFDILSNVTINGAAANATIIDAAGCEGSCDRVFDIVSEGPISAVLRALTIRNGAPPVCDADGLEDGGGIRNGFLSDLTLDRVVVSGNRAANGGGLYNVGFFSIINSTISNNEAEGELDIESFFGGDGGGINNDAGAPLPPSLPQIPQAVLLPETMPIVNTTISGNSAHEFGGGIASSGGSIALRNLTITGNTANTENFGSPEGGGVALVPVSIPTLTVRAALPGQAEFLIRNTIIAGNTDNGSEDLAPDCLVVGDGFITDEGFNLIGDDSFCGSSFVDGDNGNQVGTSGSALNPVLGPLANNGGSTPTHALLSGSPAIDLANPAGCFADDAQSVALTQDQRGLTRPADGNDDDNVRCDIGAFEVQPLCGNGTVNAGEECDDGNVANGDGCAADCTLEPACGDGTIDEGEECDDDNTVNGDGCSAECTNEVLPACGDGILQAGEECDGGDTCNEDCTLKPFCGDGTKDAGEECDDGNNATGDGCSSTCLNEAGISFLLGGFGCSLAPVALTAGGFSPFGLLAAAAITLLVKRRKIG